MIKNIFIVLFPLFFNTFSIAQDFSSFINKGRTLEINVVPIGDAYSSPNDEFTIKLMLKNSLYVIELWNKELVKKNELNENQALEVINFFENWKKDRCRLSECGLTYSHVCITIGKKKKKFRQGFNYGHEIIDKYLNTPASQ